MRFKLEFNGKLKGVSKMNNQSVFKSPEGEAAYMAIYDKTYSDTSHMVNAEQSEQVNSHILGFFKE